MVSGEKIEWDVELDMFELPVEHLVRLDRFIDFCYENLKGSNSRQFTLYKTGWRKYLPGKAKLKTTITINYKRIAVPKEALVAFHKLVKRRARKQMIFGHHLPLLDFQTTQPSHIDGRIGSKINQPVMKVIWGGLKDRGTFFTAKKLVGTLNSTEPEAELSPIERRQSGITATDQIDSESKSSYVVKQGNASLITDYGVNDVRPFHSAPPERRASIQFHSTGRPLPLRLALSMAKRNAAWR